MKGITMPPGTVQVLEVTDDCMIHGETLKITFNDPGFFGSVPSNAFTPNLPAGFFPAGTVLTGFTAPNTDEDVVFCFFDLGANFGLYLEDLEIRATCPKPRARKKKKK